MSISVSSRKSVLAMSFARKMANGSLTASRRELSVSLVCSRRKHGCNMSEAAKRMANQSRPGPKARDSSAVGLMAKLNMMRTTTMKTAVVVRSSRERNSVRSSLPNSAPVLESRLMGASVATEGEDGVEGCSRFRVSYDFACIKTNGAGSERGDFRFAVEAHDNGAAG